MVTIVVMMVAVVIVMVSMVLVLVAVLWSRSEPNFFAGAGAREKAPAPGCCCVA